MNRLLEVFEATPAWDQIILPLDQRVGIVASGIAADEEVAEPAQEAPQLDLGTAIEVRQPTMDPYDRQLGVVAAGRADKRSVERQTVSGLSDDDLFSLPSRWFVRNQDIAC